MDHELSIDLILQSLPHSYASFVLNYRMNKISITIPELINMLKKVEVAIKKESSKAIMVVSSSSSSKKGKKKKNKKKTTGTQSKVSMKKKGKAKVTSQTNAECFHCGKTGHWKRNCKEYLESKKKKHEDALTSGIYVIEINTSTTNDNCTWVLDTGCGSHLVFSMQGLTVVRR